MISELADAEKVAVGKRICQYDDMPMGAASRKGAKTERNAKKDVSFDAILLSALASLEHPSFHQ
jgi:hypothetical protein